MPRTLRPCLIRGCDRSAHAKGFCKPHYDEIRAGRFPTPPKPVRRELTPSNLRSDAFAVHDLLVTW